MVQLVLNKIVSIITKNVKYIIGSLFTMSHLDSNSGSRLNAVV